VNQYIKELNEINLSIRKEIDKIRGGSSSLFSFFLFFYRCLRDHHNKSHETEILITSNQYLAEILYQLLQKKIFVREDENKSEKLAAAIMVFIFFVEIIFIDVNNTIYQTT
jgi:hypothetical protein